MIKAIILSVKCAWKTDKYRFFYEIAFNIIKQFFNVFYGVYFLRILLVYVETGRDFFSMLFILGFMLAINILFYFINGYYKEVYRPCFDVKFNQTIYEKIVLKASHVPYDIYNTPDFLNNYNRVISNTAKNMNKILDSIGTMVGIIVAIGMIVIYIIPVDPFAILLSLVPIVYSYFICEKSEIYRFELDQRTTISNRKKDYASRIFYLPKYAKEIKMTNVSSAVCSLYDEGINENITHRKIMGKKIAFYNFIEFCVGDILVIMVPIAYVAIRVMTGTFLMIGDFVGIAQSINYFGWDIEWFFDMIFNIKSASLYINEYMDYIEFCNNSEITYSKKTRRDCEGNEDFLVVFKNVSYAYPGSTQGVFALQNINLEIKKGEKIAIVGENGAGKTTLVQLLIHLISCTKGIITLDNRGIEDFESDQLRDYFGVVLQDFNLYPLSIRDNININGTLDDDEIWDVLHKVGLDLVVQDLNTQITREISDKGIELSGGQQQRLLLARVIANKYPFVIFDEPTSSLDPLAEKEIYRLFFEVLSDRTLLFISHRLATTQFVDRIFVLKDGTIVECGTHKQLMERNGYYSYLYTTQESMYKEKIE